MTKRYGQPLLAKFEEVIESPAVSKDIRYDPIKMLLVKEDVAVSLIPGINLGDNTKHTRVRQETTDDE